MESSDDVWAPQVDEWWRSGHAVFAVVRASADLPNGRGVIGRKIAIADSVYRVEAVSSGSQRAIPEGGSIVLCAVAL